MTSKLSMRAKKLQFNVKLKIYNAEDIVLEDQTAMRSMIHVSTGVEKDEEEEHHLQRFISASQLDGPKNAFYIPTPDASKEVANYDELYKANYIRPLKPIRLYNAIIDELATTDTYDLDEEDNEWIHAYNTSSKSRALTEEQVEKVVTRLEQLVNERKNDQEQPLPNLSDLGPDTNITGESASAIYDYWKKKRERLGRSLMNLLKPETKPNDPDPYVCFRRRELRQTRKSRRNDQQSYEKLVKLRTELDRARTLVDYMRKRDRLKKEQLLLELLIFEQRARIHAIELKNPELAIRKEKISQQQQQQQQRISIKLPAMGRPLGQDMGDMRAGMPARPPPMMTIERKPMMVLPPPPEIEQIVDWSKFNPPEAIFRGMDLNHNLYNRLSDHPLSNTRSEDQYVDMTHAVQWVPKDPQHRSRKYGQVLIDSKKITSARLRMGRNGRLWIDRSSHRPSQLLDMPKDGETPILLASKETRSLRKRTFDLTDDESDDDGDDDVDVEVPRSFLSMPLVLFSPQDLHLLNGGAETQRIKKARDQARPTTAFTLSTGPSPLLMPPLKPEDQRTTAVPAVGSSPTPAGPPRKMTKLGSNGVPAAAPASPLNTAEIKGKGANKLVGGTAPGSKPPMGRSMVRT